MRAPMRMPSLGRRQSGPARGGRLAQAGFTIIELTVVAVITTILTVAGTRFVANEALKATGEGVALYIDTVRGGVDTYVANNFGSLSNGTAIPGYANPLAPTLAELQAGNFLPNTLPAFSPFNIRPLVQLTRVGCPGATCRVNTLVYLQAPLAEPDGTPRIGLAVDIRSKIRGGVASLTAANNLSGPTVATLANPVNQLATVGAYSFADGASTSEFVRRNDVRLTTLNEALTLNAGPLATAGRALDVNGNQRTTGNNETTGNLTVGGTATVTGATTLNGTATIAGATQINNNLTTRNGTVAVQNAGGTSCVTLAPTGVITIGCTGTLNARTGTFTDGLGNVTTINENGVTATGRLRGQQGLATSSATLFDAGEPDTIRLTGTNTMFVRGPGGDLLRLDAGDVVAPKNLAGQRLSIQSVVNPGAACSNTSGGTGAGLEFAATATGGLAVCPPGAGARWVALSQIGTLGSACPIDGATGNDPTTGAGLICRGGRWTKTNSLLSNFVLIKTEAVANDQNVVKPSCAPNGGAFAGVPLLLIQAGNEGSSDATFNRYAVNNGANWTVKLVDSTGTPLGGALAIAMSYCYYQDI